MEATETVTVTSEATPTGHVETRSTTIERDEGDITESWLNERFDALRAAVQQQLSELTTTVTQQLESLANRLPNNLTELLSQQQSTITKLVTDQTELVRTLLTPPAVPEPVAVVVADDAPAPTLESPAVAVVPEPARPKRRTV